MFLKSGKVFRTGIGMRISGTLAIVVASAVAQSGPKPPTDPQPRLAETVFQNVQVLKGMPAYQMKSTMQFISGSLGVQCDYCHTVPRFSDDDKKTLQTARKMIQMELAINKANFDGRMVVTCYTCHRGSTKPLATPILSEEAKAKPPQAAGSSTIQLTANQIVDKYVQALGGAAAIQKLSSLVEKGTIDLGGNVLPLEITAKAPDKRIFVMRFPNGASVTAYDGHSAWVALPATPPRDLYGGDYEGAKLEADFYFPLNIRKVFTELRMEQPEKINDRETNVIAALNEGKPPVKLYFDQQSGLLVRIVYYTESPIGLSPTQTDFYDYRDAGGVKIPFRWTSGKMVGRNAITIEKVEVNVPVEDEKFAKPELPPLPPPKPSIED